MNYRSALAKTIATLPPDQLEYYSVHQARLQYLLKQISYLHLPDKARILDIGCYPPIIYQTLSLCGYHVYGISSPHEPLDLPGVRTLNIDEDRLPFKVGRFDLILMTEVIEHLINHPPSILSQIHHLLKSQGRLIITTPNATRSQNLFLMLAGKNPASPLSPTPQSPYHRHNREYTATELKQSLTQYQFSRIDIRYFVSYTPFRSKNRPDPLWLKLIKHTNYIFMAIFPRRRDSIFVLATK